MEGIEGMNTLAEFLAQPGYGQIFNQAASRPNDAAAPLVRMLSLELAARCRGPKRCGSSVPIAISCFCFINPDPRQ